MSDASTGHTLWRAAAALALLLAQLGFVVFTHLAGVNAARLFVWAPNDYVVDYACTARVNGRVLGPQEFAERYRMPARGFHESPPESLTDFLRAREAWAGGTDRVELTLHYRLNGHAPQVWRWTHP
jgi:hypothetical protein